MQSAAEFLAGNFFGLDVVAVSYTHLDVYKRQEQHPPKPEDFGMADTPVQHVGGITEPKPREGFAGSLFDTVEDVYKRQQYGDGIPPLNLR